MTKTGKPGPDKKLLLNRETVRALDPLDASQLEQVVGGDIPTIIRATFRRTIRG